MYTGTRLSGHTSTKYCPDFKHMMLTHIVWYKRWYYCSQVNSIPDFLFMFCLSKKTMFSIYNQIIFIWVNFPRTVIWPSKCHFFCPTFRHLYGQNFGHNPFLRVLDQHSGPANPQKCRLRPILPNIPKKKHENWVTLACDSSTKMIHIHF